MTDKTKKSRFVSDYLVIDIMSSLMVCFSVISVAVIGLVYFTVSALSYRHLCTLTFVSVAFVFLRRLRIPQFLMIASHFIAGALYLALYYYYILDGTPELLGATIFMGTCVFALFIHSMTYRYSKKTRHILFDNLVVFLSVHSVLIFTLVVMGATGKTFYILLDSIMLVVLHFAARQLDVFDTKYYHNLHSSTQPIKSMKSQNHYSIFLIFGGIMFALILLLFMPVETISAFIQGVIGAVFSFLGYILNLLNKWAHGSGSEYNNHGAELVQPDAENYEPSDASMIITIIIIVAIALLLFFIVINAIRRLIKRFQLAEGSEKVIERNDAVIDIIEEVPKTKKISGKHLDFGEGYEGKIRKQYYNTVTRAIRKGITVKKGTSPRQIEQQIKEKGDPSISELTSLYESVRYNKKNS
ncbi:MAG TPA: hypothetical protein DEO39_01635 [Clostridiales bacterium]|nr:hypothetical protein [Clostridiales bacterium]